MALVYLPGDKTCRGTTRLCRIRPAVCGAVFGTPSFRPNMLPAKVPLKCCILRYTQHPPAQGLVQWKAVIVQFSNAPCWMHVCIRVALRCTAYACSTRIDYGSR